MATFETVEPGTIALIQQKPKLTETAEKEIGLW